MTIEQICLLVVLNILVGAFIMRLGKNRVRGPINLLLVAMILTGFAMIWRSLML